MIGRERKEVFVHERDGEREEEKGKMAAMCGQSSRSCLKGTYRNMR